MNALKYDPHNRMADISTEVKLTWALGLSIAVLFTNSIITQLVLLGLIICLAVAGGLKAKVIFDYYRLFLPIFSIIFILHLFYHDGILLFSIWFLKATDTGLIAGLLNLIRFISFILIAICFFSWTSPLDISKKLTAGLKFLSWKFIQDLALIFFIATRFLPVLVKEREIVMMAMKARGADFRGGLVKKMRMNLKLLLPLFSRVIGQTDDVASALALKGSSGVYFAGTRSKLNINDWLLIILSIALAAVLVYYG